MPEFDRNNIMVLIDLWSGVAPVTHERCLDAFNNCLYEIDRLQEQLDVTYRAFVGTRDEAREEFQAEIDRLTAENKEMREAAEEWLSHLDRQGWAPLFALPGITKLAGAVKRVEEKDA